MPKRRFSGDPQTRWLTEPGSDRNMELLADFWFKDGNGRTWTAPKGAVVNGASIPKPLWSTVGSPYTGDYRRASIVHDMACDAAGDDLDARRAADRMFFEACRAGGCSRWEASVLYVGVRIGAGWGESLIAQADVRLTESREERELRADVAQVSDEVLRPGETDDPIELETRTDAAFAKVGARRLAAAAAFAPR